MILLLDNYDSFTYNLQHYFQQAGINPVVLRNDELIAEEFFKLPLKALVISPGPERPERSGLLLPILDHFLSKIPIFGICLGHQAIGQLLGAKLQRAPKPVHGKTSTIVCKQHYLFESLEDEIEVMRYHSLVLNNCPHTLKIIAETTNGINMAIQHKELPVLGVQFHPESILTKAGLQMIKNWVCHHQLAE